MGVVGFITAVAAFTTAIAGMNSQYGVIPGIRAQVRAVSSQVPLGHPVLIRFTIENTASEPVTLTVPGTEPQIPSPDVGLPTTHVFSGGSVPSVIVQSEGGRKWDQAAGYRPPATAPILMVAPGGFVGTTLDLREYFPALRGAGQFRITWQPYAGAVTGETILINIAPLKNAEIMTDEGTMVLRMHYDDAPLAVANFLELVKSGFYSGKTFHRIAPGYMIQGGCPRGDGTGIRLDGKRVAAELNSRRHVKGTVSMALLDDDPNSASCQFFICNTEMKDWDGRYTVFAQLEGEESLATLDKLMALPVDDVGRPIRPFYIRSARLIDAPIDAPFLSP